MSYTGRTSYPRRTNGFTARTGAWRNDPMTETQAGKIRQELNGRGVLVQDTREGTKWRRK